MLKMTMEIHNQHENKQHLQVMQAMTLICIAKHQQEEKMEEPKKRRCKEKKRRET
jgi:hypothetical protein